MKDPSFRGKPSSTHLIWLDRNSQGDGVQKRFHEEGLRKWCQKCGVDFERDKRVDHERDDEPHLQYRCVFSWQDHADEEFEMDGESWDLSTQKTPRTFVEIDDEGKMRVKSWDDEYVLDVHELWYDGPSLVFEAAEFDGRRRLKAKKLKP